MGKIDNAISVNAVSFAFARKKVLEDITCNIPKGKFTVIMGENGSGKSTLLRLMAGFLTPDKGQINISETPLSQLSIRQKAQSVGFLGQQHQAVFPFTVFEVVMTGRASFIGIAPKESDNLIVEESIEKVGIGHLKNRFYTDLSGGEQQLVMIARILTQKPKILLLDEPISHLDFHNQIKIVHLIKQIVSEGITVAATLHDPNTAFLFGDYFLFVHGEKVLADSSGAPWSNPILKEIYQEEMETVSYKGKNIVLPKNL